MTRAFRALSSPVHPSADCQKALDLATQEKGNIDQESIFTPLCNDKSSSHKRLLSGRQLCESCPSYSDILFDNWTDASPSILPIYRELIAAGLRIWIYTGNADSVVPVPSTRYALYALNLPITDDWYPWYISQKVGGWSRVYKGLTYVIVNGAGHEVPLHRPNEALIIIKSFLEDKPMPQLCPTLYPTGEGVLKDS